MADLGVSPKDYDELISEITSEFHIISPNSRRRGESFLSAIIRRWNGSEALCPPDLSVEQVLEVIYSGEWPDKYVFRVR